MDRKALILWLTAVLGLVGIYLATLVLGPADMPFWAEFAKWSPAVLISMFAFYSAHQSKESADSARQTAEHGAEHAAAAREATQVARAEARASLTRRQRKRVDKAAAG